MNGQWLGVKHMNPGLVQRDSNLVINIDKLNHFYRGAIFDWPLDPPHICAFIPLQVPIDLNPFTFESRVYAFAGPNEPQFVDGSEYFGKLTGKPVSVPRRVYVEGDWCGDRMRLSYTTDLGTGGHAVVERMGKNPKSDLVARRITWEEAKNVFGHAPYRTCAYRGHANSEWPLRSLYHREGRADLYRYNAEDMRLLYNRLSGSLPQPMNMLDNDSRGGFLHLLQHHGYPTPLLDWSYSPYVAAFFAFRHCGVAQDGAEERYVRIFKFDMETYLTTVEPISLLATPRSNLTFMEFPTQNNPRAVPQHALSALTSVDDIERYIKLREGFFGKAFLEAFDIPISEASKALSDLRSMGITVGSLFPGIDGACEEMRSVRFP
ncbi:FRG domain-containing protein [Paraburkholderia phytofirmans]|uniref:FRG domain-containing protein n=1 Tax=Paraburkholderia phytofirmans TaxID=261302 RepID=A0ABW9BJ68_9BURK